MDEANATASSKAVLTALIPDDAVPGESHVLIDTGVATDGGGREVLRVTVPDEALPGDELLARCGEDGSWKISITRASPEGRARKTPERERGHKVVMLPSDIVPGESTFQIQVAGGTQLTVTVPAAAVAGDKLSLVEGVDGSWSVTIVRTDGEKMPLHVALTNVAVDPVGSYESLVAAARAAGGFVSEKLKRGVAPPLNLVGMMTLEPIEKGEELIRMKLPLCLTPSTLKQAMPDTWNGVVNLPGVMPRIVTDSAICACLTRLMIAAIDRVVAGQTAAPSGRPSSVWATYCEALLGEDFEGHPYWRAIGGQADGERQMQPSPEWEHASTMAGDVLQTFSRLKANLDAELIGGERFEAGLFLQARLCMLSRIFATDEEPALVPVVDLFNHSADNGVEWGWDASSPEGGAMVVTALRAHAAGEALTISYGMRPNPLLLRTYGFTLPPSEEPSWCFVLQGAKPRDLYDSCLPKAMCEMTIHLDTRVLQESLTQALNACASQGCDAAEFLRAICRRCREPYEADEMLRPALQALERARAKNRSSAAWWEELGADEEPSGVWAEACMRIKMSEYLCMTTHIEFVEHFEGNLAADQCLGQCATMRGLMNDALGELKKHGRFSCTSTPIPRLEQ